MFVSGATLWKKKVGGDIIIFIFSNFFYFPFLKISCTSNPSEGGNFVSRVCVEGGGDTGPFISHIPFIFPIISHIPIFFFISHIPLNFAQNTTIWRFVAVRDNYFYKYSTRIHSWQKKWYWIFLDYNKIHIPHPSIFLISHIPIFWAFIYIHFLGSNFSQIIALDKKYFGRFFF